MGRRSRERGFALVVVLGALPILAMLGSVVQLAGRSEMRLAGNLRGEAVREAAVDGAVREAIFRLVAGDWSADGAARVVRVGGQAMEVRIENEAGKINPSVAPLGLLRALLLVLGVEPTRAESLAACIVDYRDGGDTPSPHGAKAAAYRAAEKAYGPSGLPFQRMDELRLVLGMTDDVYRRMEPYLSLSTGQGIDQASAGPEVRTAFRMAGPYGGYFGPMEVGGALIASISARVAGAGAATLQRRAIVRVYSADSPDQAFEVVDWSTRRR